MVIPNTRSLDSIAHVFAWAICELQGCFLSFLLPMILLTLRPEPLTAEEKSSFLKGSLVSFNRSRYFFENHGCLIELGFWEFVLPPLLGETILGLDGVAISSDAFFPFRDSIDHATRSGWQCNFCLQLWQHWFTWGWAWSTWPNLVVQWQMERWLKRVTPMEWPVS